MSELRDLGFQEAGAVSSVVVIAEAEARSDKCFGEHLWLRLDGYLFCGLKSVGLTP